MRHDEIKDFVGATRRLEELGLIKTVGNDFTNELSRQ